MNQVADSHDRIKGVLLKIGFQMFGFPIRLLAKDCIILALRMTVCAEDDYDLILELEGEPSAFPFECLLNDFQHCQSLQGVILIVVGLDERYHELILVQVEPILLSLADQERI